MRTLILGLDAFDPVFFENLHEQGKLPNLSSLLAKGSYSRFKVANPPQSEVSWTSIATGLDPGDHGMFDFVHRNPANYSLSVSLLPTGRSLGGIQFVRPYNARTIFDMAAERGYPATSLWWPATFPARPESPVRTLPGLGTPDIQGRLGVGMFFTTDPDHPEKIGKTPASRLKKTGSERFSGELEGSQIKAKGEIRNAVLLIEIRVRDESHVELRIGKSSYLLTLDEWSPIIEVQFHVSLLANIHAITRVILTSIKPHLQLYFLPLQIHPLHPLWRYGTPTSFVRQAWTTSGPFLSLGWPQDTTGLEDGCMNDNHFLRLCESIDDAREKLLFHLLDQFDEGLLASVFDSLDRIQHMFWKTRPDILETWYIRYDRLVGQILTRLGGVTKSKTRLLIVSDHGFKDLDYKVHLNRWLIEQEYLSSSTNPPIGDLKQADWNKTQAYAVGLNSLYLNLQGREGQGVVAADQIEPVSDRLLKDLANWRGPDGRQVVQSVARNVPGRMLSDFGPDFLIGYSAGYRASAETGLGGWKAETLETNRDHWGADHCYDPDAVPGILFYSDNMDTYPAPSYRDIPAMAIDAAPDARGSTPPPTPSLNDEDQSKVEERLKSLGYL